jgi:hypothetical protein
VATLVRTIAAASDKRRRIISVSHVHYRVVAAVTRLVSRGVDCNDARLLATRCGQGCQTKHFARGISRKFRGLRAAKFVVNLGRE